MVLQYLTTLQRWNSLKSGPLAQNLPNHVNGRDYLSSGRARQLRLPYSKSEALFKMAFIDSALDDDWLQNSAKLIPQKELLIDALNLGAYSLPNLILKSEKVDLHVRDYMHKDLVCCLDELKRGNYRLAIEEC